MTTDEQIKQAESLTKDADELLLQKAEELESRVRKICSEVSIALSQYLAELSRATGKYDNIKSE